MKKDSVNRFALIGAAGYVAPKHLKAIADTGNQLVAALDPHDSVGILDSYFPETRFFTEVERFDRHLEKLRRSDSEPPVDYVSICSPNYLHDAHVRLALRVKAHAICEKPLVINPWNLDQLEELEQEHGRRVHTVLQLRHLPAAVQLRAQVEAEANDERPEVCLTYITRRGAWYRSSWKGNEDQSGGLALNIGIHFFDLLTWIFGAVGRNIVHELSATRASGYLDLEQARVRWFLSVNKDDLPATVRAEGGHAYRSLTIDEQEVDLSAGFTDLHTEVYRNILAGGGFGIADARSAIEVVHEIRKTDLTRCSTFTHPLLDQSSARPVARTA